MVVHDAAERGYNRAGIDQYHGARRAKHKLKSRLETEAPAEELGGADAGRVRRGTTSMSSRAASLRL